MDVTYVQTQDPQIVAAIGRLRAAVWRDEPEIAFHEFGDAECWTDAFDESAIHWAVYHEGELVAAARLSLHSGSQTAPYGHVFTACGVELFGVVASINRLVVGKAYRGRGIARALDHARLAKALELGASAVLALPVGQARLAALARHGYILIARDLDPQSLSLSLANAKVGVMVAPLPGRAATGAVGPLLTVCPASAPEAEAATVAAGAPPPWLGVGSR